MTQNIGPLNREVPPFAEMHFNGNPITHYMDIVDLPEGDKGETCSQHINDGIAAEMMSEFHLFGCHFPEAGEEQMIRTAFVCPGPSILKKCRLRLIQADAVGKVLTEGKVEKLG